MSRGADVLSTLDDAAMRVEAIHGPTAAYALREARAAVAELVGAIKESREALQAFANDGMPPNYFRHVEAEARLDAALAKFGAKP